MWIDYESLWDSRGALNVIKYNLEETKRVFNAINLPLYQSYKITAGAGDRYLKTNSVYFGFIHYIVLVLFTSVKIWHSAKEEFSCDL